MELITGFSRTQQNIFQKPKNKNIAFKGTTIETLPDGKKRHVFYLPTTNSTLLEVVPVMRDEKTGDYHKTEVNGQQKQIVKPQDKPLGHNQLWLSPQNDTKSLLNIYNPKIKLAYRFLEEAKNGQIKVGEKSFKPILDEGRQVKLGNTTYNLAWDPERPNRKKPIVIYTAMPDMQKYGITTKRDPFNVYGAQIGDMINRLDVIKELGNTHIHSTPLFKNGPANNHGYWTNNLYQIDPTRGGLKEFKNLQIDLMNRDMGFIADLAAINESWEGIHVKDVIKYGKDSPFANNFYLYNANTQDWAKPGELEDVKLIAPMLPRTKQIQDMLLDDAESKKPIAWENLGIKLINAPFQLDYSDDKQGPVVKPNTAFDRKLPTKIQIFDRRRLTPEEQNSNELIIKYNDKLEPENPAEILDFDDSVQLAHFNITNDEGKLKRILDAATTPEGRIDIETLAATPDWGTHVKLGPAGTGTNIKNWDGQNDIIKFRFFYTDEELAEMTPAQRAIALKASAQSQDNIVQAGEYWTGWDEKIKTEYRAKQISKQLKGITEPEKRVAVIKDLENRQPDDVNKLPKGSSLIIKSTYNPETQSYEGPYNLKTAPLPNNIIEGLMSLPLEAIEFPDEVCSILTGPHIKKLAAKKEHIGVSRYELMTNEKYKKEYKNNNLYSQTYRDMDKFYAEKLAPLTKKVIDESPVLSEKIKTDEYGNLKDDDSKAIFRIVADDIVKFAVVKALADTNPINFKTMDGVKKDKDLEFDDKELAVNTFKNWKGRKENSHEDEANSLVKMLSKGIDERITNDDERKLRTYLETRVKDLDGDAIKIAKLMYVTNEEGLNWRIDAAKDGADIGKIQNEETKPRTKNTFAENWDKNIEFWKGFNDGVRKYNPMSYTIAESTDLDKAYIGDATVAVGENKGKQLGNYPIIEDVISKVEERAGFTTDSDYPHLFSALPAVAIDNEEDGCPTALLNKKLFDGWKDGANSKMGLLRALPIDSALYAHVFSDNQDMSRVLHLLSLDTGEFKKGINITDKRLTRWNENTKIGKALRWEISKNQSIGTLESKLEELNEPNEIKSMKETIKNKEHSLPRNQLDGMYNIFNDGFDWFRKAPKEKQEEDLRKWKEDWVYAQLPQKQKELYIAEKERLIKELRKDEEYNKLEEKVKAYNKKIEPQRKELEERIIDQETELDGIRKAQAAPYTAADKLMESYELAIRTPYGQEIIPKEVSELIKSATDNIANGKYNGKEYPRLPQHFAWMADDKAFDMVIKEAKYLDKKNSENNGSGRRVIDKETENKLQNEVKDRLHEKFTARGRAGVLAIKYYGALLAGAPTMYNGEEYAMTGLESQGKNEGLHDREALQPEWLKNEKIKAYYDKYMEVNSLKSKSLNKPELSPLVNGHTLRLKPISEEPNHLYGIYRYNKNTDIIGIINGAGLEETPDGEFKTKTREINKLDLSRDLLDGNADRPVGVPTKLPEGTVYVDAIDTSKRFVIDAEGNLVNAKGGNIVIDKPALILHREVRKA